MAKNRKVSDTAIYAAYGRERYSTQSPKEALDKVIALIQSRERRMAAGDRRHGGKN